MKYTIMGFSQQKLQEFNMDLTDALILRWFIDFKDTNKMYSEIVNNEKFYWIKYESLLSDIPIINIKKVPLGRRLKKLSESEILKRYIKKKGGTYTLYAIGIKYTELVSQEGLILKSIGIDSEINTGVDSKVNTKNPSTKVNSSIKEYGKHNIIKLSDKVYEKLIEDLGEEDILRTIKNMDEYLKINGKKYKDYNLAIRKWLRDDKKKQTNDEWMV